MAINVVLASWGLEIIKKRLGVFSSFGAIVAP
jgi:hypothetical protein